MDSVVLRTRQAAAEPGGASFGADRIDPSPTARGRRRGAAQAEQATRRIGTLATLTDVTAVGIAMLQSALQPEMAAIHQTAIYCASHLNVNARMVLVFAREG